MISLGGTMIFLGGRVTALYGPRFSGPRLHRISSTAIARCSALEPPDVPRLADAARISLSPKEVKDFAPKIRQAVDWFGQLQAIDLESIEPSLRAEWHLCGWLLCKRKSSCFSAPAPL